MSLCCDADELEIFESSNFQDLIVFRWDKFAFKIHMMGCIMHLFYIGIMILYINQIYIQGLSEGKEFYEKLLVIAIIYPALYDWI